jgi:diphosphomevalonate decarboxylase
MAGITISARVDSHNDFPAGAGVASSASAFAALSLAATRAAGLDLDERALSILARKGSGSACRSVPGGFVEWLSGASDPESYARQVAPPEHWDLRVLTVTFDVQPKAVSSLEGHRAALTSPFFAARLASVQETLRTVRSALLDRDFATLGCAAEREALNLHAVAMTSRVDEKPWLSGILYWQPETLELLRSVQAWRQEGLPVYFSLDAGASVHLLCEAESESRLEEVLEDSLSVLGGSYISSVPGRGAWLVG